MTWAISLGMIIEKASGQRYREFVTERSFQLLGMTATSVVDQWAILKNRASGYTLRNGQLSTSDAMRRSSCRRTMASAPP